MKVDYNEFLFAGRGSAALFAVLKSLSVGKRRILLPVNICEVVYPIVIKAGFTPVFYDVNADSGNGTITEIQKKYSGDESVLLAVHNFGVPLEIDKIVEWAEKNNVYLVEDVCNAIGGHYNNQMLGTWGDAAIFSFGYAKVAEYGVGGAALIKDNILRERVGRVIQSFEPFSDVYREAVSEFQLKIRLVRQDRSLQIPSIYNQLYKEYSDHLLYKIDIKTEREIQILLDKIEFNISERAQKASRYRSEIKSKNVKHIGEVVGQVYWRYNLLVEPQLRQELIKKLNDNNILVSTWYPPIIGLFERGYDKFEYAGSYSFSSRVINLFVDNRVSQTDISKAIEIINEI